MRSGWRSGIGCSAWEWEATGAAGACWDFLLCACSHVLLLQPACSSTTTQPPVSGTPAGTYTITVTATSGSDTKSDTITLTVP